LTRPDWSAGYPLTHSSHCISKIRRTSTRTHWSSYYLVDLPESCFAGRERKKRPVPVNWRWKQEEINMFYHRISNFRLVTLSTLRPSRVFLKSPGISHVLGFELPGVRSSEYRPKTTSGSPLTRVTRSHGSFGQAKRVQGTCCIRGEVS
jgi:hypothetical protein